MKLICVLLTVFALGVTPAYADDLKLDFELVTDCEMVPHRGKDLCGLTLPEWQRILKTNLTLESRSKLLGYEQDKNKALYDQRDALRIQLKAAEDKEALLLADEKKLRKDIVALDKKYQYERVRPRWGNPIAWTIAAASSVALVGLLVYKSVD